MINQTKNTSVLFDNVRGVSSSDVFQRGSLYPLRVSTKIWGASAGQSATIVIYGSYVPTPSVPLATIILTEDDSEEAYTIYSTYKYISADVIVFNTAKPGAVTVQVNAIEEL